MKKQGFAAVILSLFLGLVLFNRPAADSAESIKISPEEAKAIMDSSEKYVLLDVRTKEEFAVGHIEGALLIPHTEIQRRAFRELEDNEAIILVYCQSGRRSAIVVEELARMGYRHVYDFGSINTWPYGTVSDK